ncbi:MAG: GDSL-type esterase/lipase family protein [Bacteroidota bacterium]
MKVPLQMTSQEKRLLRLLVAVFLLLLLAIGGMAWFIMQTWPLSPFRIGLRIGLIGVTLLVLLRLMHLLLIRIELPNRRKNLVMVIGGLFFGVLVMEIPFMFIPYSHGNGNTYSSRIWFDRYWELNRFGYRDAEWELNGNSTRPRLFVLGDSFVAGHGIEDPAERFSDRLAARLNSQIQVFNLGKNGANTRAQFDSLDAFPLVPQILILSHIPNDIEGLRMPRKSEGSHYPQPIYRGSVPPFLEVLSRGSFFLNYGYWKFNGFIEGFEVNEEKERTADFGDHYIRLYDEAAVARVHRRHLEMIIDWCRHRQVKLLVLTFPELFESGIDFSQSHVNEPLAEWLTERNIPVVHAYDVIRGLPEADRIVNYNDLHPSAAAHAAVAEQLRWELARLGWI